MSDEIEIKVIEEPIEISVTEGKDGQPISPQGEWDATKAYAFLDFVYYGGSSYVAVRDVPAGTPLSDHGFWQISASGAAIWGGISGTLSDQTDLQSALDSKVSEEELQEAEEELQEALEGKADTADLGSLAYKNKADYSTDIDNAPTLGGIQVRPDYTISTTDLTDGVSSLETGKLYFYYEA